MSLSVTFNSLISVADNTKPIRKRQAPFSIRFSEYERTQLLAEAAGVPLGAYIKEKVLVGGAPGKWTRTGPTVADRKVFAQALGLLGKSRLASNLNQLARLANTGSLPLTPEVQEELMAAFREVREIRRLLMTALGLKAERTP